MSAHGCMSSCPTCQRGCLICSPCDPLKHGGLATGYPVPLLLKGGKKCDICGSTAIDHTEMHCQMNRAFKKATTPTTKENQEATA